MFTKRECGQFFAIAAMIMAAALAGCTSTRTHTLTTKNMSEMAQVTFVRNYQPRGAAAKVIIDGARVSKIAPGKYFTVVLEPGVHMVGLGEAGASYELKAGQHYYFFIRSGPANNLRMAPMEKTTARSIMKSYKPVL